MVRIEKKRQYYCSHQNCGDSITVWGTFSSKGTTELAVLDCKKLAKNDLTALESFMLPFKCARHGPIYDLMQERASIQTVCICQKLFQALDTIVLPLMAKSSDSNPIENV